MVCEPWAVPGAGVWLVPGHKQVQVHNRLDTLAMHATLSWLPVHLLLLLSRLPGAPSLPLASASCRPSAGSLLVVPAGVHKSSAEGRELNTAYVYGRGQWGSPVMHLPGHPKVGGGARQQQGGLRAGGGKL